MSRLLAIAALALALALGGCGLGDEERRTGAELVVTRDFGERTVREASLDDVPAGQTVMRLLEGQTRVEKRYGGGFVQSIEGIEGGGRRDWFYYVNGIEAEEGAAAFEVSDGDVVWWDHHDWSDTMRVPAVVGSFPAPFLSGEEGLRFPIRVDCASGAQEACDEVTERLQAAGITRIGRGAVGQSAGERVLRVLVGPWERLREDAAVDTLSRGPRATGVFARFTDAGELELLDAAGGVRDTLGPGAGLVAATRLQEQRPTWIVAGTDAAGTAAAAAALREEVLDKRFAVAIDGGRPRALPVRAGEPEPEEPQ